MNFTGVFIILTIVGIIFYEIKNRSVGGNNGQAGLQKYTS
jgi:hypothetical protein